MAIPYELLVAEDLDLGHGTVSRTMPAGGSATGTQVNLGTFRSAGVLYSTLLAASEVPGMLIQVRDAASKTPGATLAGGGAFLVLAFSNGTTWLVVMG